MKKEKIKICNKIGCKKEGKIKTYIGWFCSENCRAKIIRNIFKALLPKIKIPNNK